MEKIIKPNLSINDVTNNSDVLCACTGKKCCGACREQHLIDTLRCDRGHSPICPAAYRGG